MACHILAARKAFCVLNTSEKKNLVAQPLETHKNTVKMREHLEIEKNHQRASEISTSLHGSNMNSILSRCCGHNERVDLFLGEFMSVQRKS